MPSRLRELGPGILEVMCRFSGLINFPSDRLSCNVEIGGWALGGGLQGVYAQNGGFSFSTEDAAQDRKSVV